MLRVYEAAVNITSGRPCAESGAMRGHRKFPSTFEGLLQLGEVLRGPGGCAWDKSQTTTSLKSLFLEECYEFVEAIDSGSDENIVEEMGDVLFHIGLQLCMAKEKDSFGESDVFSAIVDKMIRRHPHIFGGSKVSSIEDIEKQWSDIKRGENDNKTDLAKNLDNVPKSMPALLRAKAFQDIAAETGFDWEDVDGVLDKVLEEIQEFRQANTKEDVHAELGDILFSIVNLARWVGADSEDALRASSERFKGRFKSMLNQSSRDGISFSRLDSDQQNLLWQHAKTEKD